MPGLEALLAVGCDGRRLFRCGSRYWCGGRFNQWWMGWSARIGKKFGQLFERSDLFITKVGEWCVEVDKVDLY